MNMRDKFEFYTFYITTQILKRLPYKFVIVIIKTLFYIAGIGIGIRKKVITSQLKLCFPNKTVKEINNLTRAIYNELAITCAEVFVFDENYFNNKIELVNFEELDKALTLGRGAIIVSAHFGNWEIGAKLIAKKHSEVWGIVKSIRNKMFNNYIEDQRQKQGIRTVEMKSALKKIISALDKNKVVAILVDQYAAKQGVEMNFMGHNTKVYTSVAQIAIKYKTPIIPAFDIRDKDGKHKYIFHEAIIINDENTDTIELTRHINSFIEEYITKYPQLWFWLNRKWRSS